ncbi:hypothetical protein [Methylobacter sp.]
MPAAKELQLNNHGQNIAGMARSYSIECQGWMFLMRTDSSAAHQNRHL